MGRGTGWERGKVNGRKRPLEREQQRELKTASILVQFFLYCDKKTTEDLKGFPLSHLWLGGVGACPSRTRSQSLIFNISILSQEEKPPPPGLKQELFPISLFKPVSRLNRETTLPPFYRKWSFREPSDVLKITPLVNDRLGADPGLCDSA